MEGFTLIDGGALFVLAVSALLAYSRGLVRELLSIAGWLAAAVAAFFFAGDAEPLVREAPVLRDIIGTNCELARLAAFGIIFVIALIVVSIFTPLIAGAIQNSALGPVDQGLGFLFGLARGALLIVIALVVYDQIISGGNGIPMVEDSRTVEILSQTQAQVATFIEEQETPEWFSSRVEQLLGTCGETTE